MGEGEVNLTYSAILSKDKKKIVRVCFERDEGDKKSIAEGVLPDGVIEKNTGFSDDEVSKLEFYLRENEEDIMAKAKSISGIMNWFK